MSDLTLGDAWGIEKYMPEMDDDRGTSAVVINSEKGAYLWDAIQGAVQAQFCRLDVLLPPKADARWPVAAHPNRSKFFAAVRQGTAWEKLQQLRKIPVWRKAVSKARHWVVLLKN